MGNNINNDVNENVLARVKNQIAYQNLVSEEINMKNKMKKCLTVTCMALLIISCSAFTVNAATEGKLFEGIKAFFVNKDGEKSKLPVVEKIVNGKKIYEINYKDDETGHEVKAAFMDTENFSADLTISQADGEDTIAIKSINDDYTITKTEVDGTTPVINLNK